MDKRFLVDYLCKDEDVPGSGLDSNRLNNTNCRYRILRDIASFMGVSEHDIMRNPTRSQLCNLVNARIIIMDIESALLECHRNIGALQLRAMQSDKLDVLGEDLQQLIQWYNNIATSAEQQVQTGNLQKLVELRNQVVGSCKTFMTGLNSKLDASLKSKVKDEKRKSFLGRRWSW